MIFILIPDSLPHFNQLDVQNNYQSIAPASVLIVDPLDALDLASQSLEILHPVFPPPISLSLSL